MIKDRNSVLLWNGTRSKDNRESLFFSRPHDVILCWNLEDIENSFNKIERYLKKGFYAAGYISYEAGFAFEENLKKLARPGGILMWFGIYRKPAIFRSEIPRGRRFQLEFKGLSINKNKYKAALEKIKGYIAKGETYQVNYTIKKYYRFRGNPYFLFSQLCRNQEVPYAAFIKNDYEYILSLSPELFFQRQKEKINVRPMKGTIDRGKDAASDCANAFALKNSVKDRAENIMIVDLLRNDLGRISRIGSVRTNSLFDVERLNTLWQMTSSVSSRLKNGLSWYELFKNIFPSGSVTGAPKIRTMKIIDALESSWRGVYTGSIGYIGPDNYAMFNVAIRTLRIDRKSKECDLGIGSGIVWDSTTEREWQECQLKSKFTEGDFYDFQLIETMALRKAEISLLPYHLERLGESANYFNFCFRRREVLFQIKRFIEKLDRAKDYKLRLLLSKDGQVSIKSQALRNYKQKKQGIVFSHKRTNSKDSFLYHKTTKRDIYNQEHKRLRKAGYFDCIFKNELGHVTEGAISNIFIEKNSKLYTPRSSCGLLNGVYRRFSLATIKPTPQECILRESDIRCADKIYLTNAISGIIRVYLER